MEKYSRIKNDLSDKKFDAIVIGSGISGLSSASCLAQQGMKVLVLEQHYIAGGMTHTFSRKGYTWDVGLHYVGRVLIDDPIARAMSHISQGQLQWTPMNDEYDRVKFPEYEFSFIRGKENLRKRLYKEFPQEIDAINTYLDMVARVGRAMQLNVLGEAGSTHLGDWFKNLCSTPLRNEGRKTTESVLDSLTDNQRLKAVLCGQWGNYGLPPKDSSFAMHALVARHYMEGGAYLKGGSVEIVNTIAPIIESVGGMIVTSASVDEIIIDKSDGKEKAVGVRMDDGIEIKAPHVISTAGQWVTENKLLRNHLTPTVDKPSSTAHYALFIGAHGTTESLGLANQNLWVYPDEDHNKNVAAYRKDMNAPFPVMFFSSGSAKDPLHQELDPYKSTLEVVVPANFSDVKKWMDTKWRKRGSEYEFFKKKLTNRILEETFKHFPKLAGNIRWTEFSTPLTTNHFCATHEGEIYGKGAYTDRMANGTSLQKISIKGLELAGQDNLLFGVSGAMISGVLAASKVGGLSILKNAFTSSVNVPQLADLSKVA